MRTQRTQRHQRISSAFAAFLAVCAFCAACVTADLARGQTPINPDVPLPPDSGVDSVLDALDERGKNLKDFTADVKLSEQDRDNGDDPVSRTGRVWFKNRDPNDPADDAKLHVTFDKKRVGRSVSEEKVEYLLSGGWLWDRDYRKQIEVKRQVLRPGQKMDLLKLGEGPFPLPIGQDREAVLKQFTVTKVAPAKGPTDEPADTIHLQLKPRPGTRLARRFAVIDVWVDLKTRMPVRIEAAEANAGTVRSTELKNVKVNVGLKEDAFTLPKVTGWQQREEPYAE